MQSINYKKQESREIKKYNKVLQLPLDCYDPTACEHHNQQPVQVTISHSISRCLRRGKKGGMKSRKKQAKRPYHPLAKVTKWTNKNN